MPELRIVLKVLALMWIARSMIVMSPRTATEPVLIVLVVFAFTAFVALVVFSPEIFKWLEDCDRASPRTGAA